MHGIYGCTHTEWCSSLSHQVHLVNTYKRILTLWLNHIFFAHRLCGYQNGLHAQWCSRSSLLVYLVPDQQYSTMTRINKTSHLNTACVEFVGAYMRNDPGMSWRASNRLDFFQYQYERTPRHCGVHTCIEPKTSTWYQNYTIRSSLQD